jgi:hypothetical protein
MEAELQSAKQVAQLAVRADCEGWEEWRPMASMGRCDKQDSNLRIALEFAAFANDFSWESLPRGAEADFFFFGWDGVGSGFAAG